MSKIQLQYKMLFALFMIVLLTSLGLNNIYILVLFSILTYFILPFNKWWNSLSVTLLAFSLFYTWMVVMTGRNDSNFILIAYSIAPVAFYRWGRSLMYNFVDDSQREKLLFTIILCYLLTLFVVTIKDINDVGIINISRSMSAGIGHADTLSATLYGLMASLGIGCISYLFADRYNLWIRFGFVILSLLSLLVVLHLINRTGLFIFIGCMLLAFLLASKITVPRIIKTLFTVGCIVGLIAASGIFGEELFLAYQNRETTAGYSSAELGGRTELWMDSISKLATHPFGWQRTRYAHNLWLDIGRVGGWGSLLLFLIVSAKWFKSIMRLIKVRQSPFSLLIISMNVSVLLASFVEPVIEASILYFSLLMMLLGITESISKAKS